MNPLPSTGPVIVIADVLAVFGVNDAGTPAAAPPGPVIAIVPVVMALGVNDGGTPGAAPPRPVIAIVPVVTVFGHVCADAAPASSASARAILLFVAKRQEVYRELKRPCNARVLPRSCRSSRRRGARRGAPSRRRAPRRPPARPPRRTCCRTRRAGLRARRRARRARSPARRAAATQLIPRASGGAGSARSARAKSSTGSPERRRPLPVRHARDDERQPRGRRAARGGGGLADGVHRLDEDEIHARGRESGRHLGVFGEENIFLLRNEIRTVAVFQGGERPGDRDGAEDFLRRSRAACSGARRRPCCAPSSPFDESLFLFLLSSRPSAARRARATALAMSSRCEREQELSLRFLPCSRKLAIVRTSAPASAFSRWIASTRPGASRRAWALQRGAGSEAPRARRSVPSARVEDERRPAAGAGRGNPGRAGRARRSPGGEDNESPASIPAHGKPLVGPRPRGLLRIRRRHVPRPRPGRAQRLRRPPRPQVHPAQRRADHGGDHGRRVAGRFLQHERRRRREAGRGDRRDGEGPRRRGAPGRDRRRPPLARVRDPQAVPRRRACGPHRARPDGHDARRHGSFPRLLGAGPPRGGPPRRGRARLRDDVRRRTPDLEVLRRGVGREGRPREPRAASSRSSS